MLSLLFDNKFLEFNTEHKSIWLAAVMVLPILIFALSGLFKLDMEQEAQVKKATVIAILLLSLLSILGLVLLFYATSFFENLMGIWNDKINFKLSGFDVIKVLAFFVQFNLLQVLVVQFLNSNSMVVHALRDKILGGLTHFEPQLKTDLILALIT